MPEEFTNQSILKSDRARLIARAKRYNSTPTKQITAVLDLVEMYEQNTGTSLDTLPRPEGAQVVPVIEVTK
jgi:hypothetical protein